MNNQTTSIKYGLLGGIIMIAIYLLLYIIAVDKLASLITMVVYLPLTFLMIWGGITYRKEIGAYKNYGHAFVTVFLISVVATMLFDTFGYILFSVIDPDLPALLKKKSIESAMLMMERFGTPDDKVKETLAQMEEQDFAPSLKSQMIRYATSLGVGAFFSALIALFVRRGNEQPVVNTES